MNKEETLIFLKSVLVKIENAVNLITHEPPKYIPYYHKMLGVQQKFNTLDQKDKERFFNHMIQIRSVIYYVTNGYYEKSYDQLIKLKRELIQICLRIENENNKIGKL